MRKQLTALLLLLPLATTTACDEAYESDDLEFRANEVPELDADETVTCELLVEEPGTVDGPSCVVDCLFVEFEGSDPVPYCTGLTGVSGPDGVELGPRQLHIPVHDRFGFGCHDEETGDTTLALVYPSSYLLHEEPMMFGAGYYASSFSCIDGAWWETD